MPKHILIVDDSSSMRSLVRITLEQAGFQVTEAADGVEACAKLGPQPFAMVLSDLSMPRMDGLDFVRRIKCHPTHRMTPVVMLTTESSVARKEELRKAGAKAWLTKPFQPQALVDVVQRMTAQGA